MRVISGEFRSRRLETLKNNDVRPTSDKVKEAVFSSIQFEVQGSCFLDLFSGSGQMGIEALSRGAREAVFVDYSRESIKMVERNILSLNLKNKAKTIISDSILFLEKTNQKFDIAYLDPPYKTDLIDRSVKRIANVMNKNGIVICESPIEKQFQEDVNDLVIIKKRSYGTILITFFEKC